MFFVHHTMLLIIRMTCTLRIRKRIISIKTTESTSGTTTTTTTETVPAEKGNVNEDYTIDISDASMVLLMYANSATGMDMSEYTEKQLSAADVDEDEMITISDAAYILTFYAQTAAGMNPSWESILKK